VTPSTLYIGTVNGLSKSTDGGVGIDFNQLLGASIQGIAVDPEEPLNVYVSTRFQLTFRSSDGGQSWESAAAGLPTAELRSLAIDPGNPNRLWTGASGSGVYRTEDRGSGWELASSGISGADVRALAIDPLNSSRLLAAVTGGQIFQSENSGEDWDEARQGISVTQIRSLAIDPSNPQTVYAGVFQEFTANAPAMFRSSDGGSQWSELVFGTSVYSIAIDPGNTRTLYIGTDQGVYKSSDGGQGFDGVNDLENVRDGLTSWTVLDLMVDPNNRNTLYAVGLDVFSGSSGQIFKTTNAGNEWRPSGVANFPLLSVTVDPNNSNRVYVGSFQGVFRSTNAGDTYLPANNGLPENGALTVTSVAVDGGDNSALYAATAAGMFKSTNGGESWSAAGQGLEGAALRQVVVDRSQPRRLYATTSNAGIFRSRDGGQTWQPMGAFAGSDPIISRTSITGAADFSTGVLVPGEIVAIFGRKIGPAEGVAPPFDSNGRLPTLAAGVTVLFDEVPAPLFFVREDQINAQVPFEVAGRESVTVHVEVDGVTSNSAALPVGATRPGLFPAVLNQNFSVNSAENPEIGGNFLIFFASGHGLVNPPIASGVPGPSLPPFPQPQLPISMTIGGVAVTPVAVLAPGLVGLLQLNAPLPPGLPPGEAEAILTVVEAPSSGVTVFAR
jgi:uncharacterized protein (TIGR03437 family)